MYGKIIDDKIKLGLPHTGVLADGRQVSGYNLLPQENLLAEGWRVVQEVKPEYDTTTQMLKESTREIVDGEIVITYIAIERPVEEFELEQI